MRAEVQLLVAIAFSQDTAAFENLSILPLTGVQRTNFESDPSPQRKLGSFAEGGWQVFRCCRLGRRSLHTVQSSTSTRTRPADHPPAHREIMMQPGSARGDKRSPIQLYGELYRMLAFAKEAVR